MRKLTVRLTVALFAAITFCSAQGTGSTTAQGTGNTTAQGTGNTTAQGTGSTAAQSTGGGDLDSEIEALRADFRADKTALITETMSFTEDQSKIFWPVYRKYDAELTKVNDQRVALIKQYAAKYSTMSENDAATLLDEAIKFEQNRLDLKRKYAKEFRKAGVSAVNTTKFFQVEHRLDLLVDLKLASELPMLWVKPPSKPTN
jgi:hypothetical protein